MASEFAQAVVAKDTQKIVNMALFEPELVPRESTIEISSNELFRALIHVFYCKDRIDTTQTETILPACMLALIELWKTKEVKPFVFTVPAFVMLLKHMAYAFKDTTSSLYEPLTELKQAHDAELEQADLDAKKFLEEHKIDSFRLVKPTEHGLITIPDSLVRMRQPPVLAQAVGSHVLITEETYEPEKIHYGRMKEMTSHDQPERRTYYHIKTQYDGNKCYYKTPSMNVYATLFDLYVPTRRRWLRLFVDNAMKSEVELPNFHSECFGIDLVEDKLVVYIETGGSGGIPCFVTYKFDTLGNFVEHDDQ